MARQTKKFHAALSCIRENKLKIQKMENAELYEALEKLNYFWFPKNGVWEYREFSPSTSIFEADDGTPTGIIKIRLQAHPDDLRVAIKALKLATGWRVIEISKSYKNRTGSGERIYTTVILDGGVK